MDIAGGIPGKKNIVISVPDSEEILIQYTSDNQGDTTAVQLQIPIDDSNRLKDQYSELNMESTVFSDEVSNWHMELVSKELAQLSIDRSGFGNWENARASLSYVRDSWV